MGQKPLGENARTFLLLTSRLVVVIALAPLKVVCQQFDFGVPKQLGGNKLDVACSGAELDHLSRAKKSASQRVEGGVSS